MQFSDPNADQATPRSPADARMLTAIKLVLGLLLVGFLTVGDNDKTWPLVTWPMFQGSGKSAPKSIASLHLRAIAADGKVYQLVAGALSDTLPTSASEKIVEKTFDDDLDPSERRDAQARLAAMIRSALPGVDLVEIQAWDLTWNVHAGQPPTLDMHTPTEATLLGKFALAGTEASS